MISTTHTALIAFCWMLLLVYFWARKHDPELKLVPSLLVAVIVSVAVYAPLITIRAIEWYLA